MSADAITVQGQLTADGKLVLGQALALPPGPVEVTIRAMRPAKENTWAVLQRIWAERKALGTPGRAAEEIDADVRQLRDELEDHARAVEQLQEEARRAAE